MNFLETPTLMQSQVGEASAVWCVMCDVHERTSGWKLILLKLYHTMDYGLNCTTTNPAVPFLGFFGAGFL